MRDRRLLKAFIFGALCILLFYCYNHLISYKDMSIWSSDIRMKDFKRLPEDSVSVLFVGSSSTMSGIDTMQFYQETDLTAFSLASRVQTVPLSYLYIQEALKTQSPSIIVMECNSVLLDYNYYEVAQDDKHFMMNMHALPFSVEKVKFVLAHLPLKEQMRVCFPFIDYHGNYKSIFGAQTEVSKQHYMGFCFAEDNQVNVEIVGQLDYEAVENIIPVREADMQYLNEIKQLCEEKNIRLVFVMMPMILSEADAEKMKAFDGKMAEDDNVYLNLVRRSTDMCFDYSEETMRDNKHLNSKGAEIVTAYLTDYITKNYDVSNKSGAEEIWDKELEAYMQHIALR